ncbi:hypothetical protein ACFLZ9_02245 [Patescibacteria group bacterium]
MKKLIKTQFFILLIGTVFAWSNFTLELFAWLNNKACETGCSATGQVVNPFLTPCFYGALFFTLAFILSLLLLLAARNKKTKKEKDDIDSPTASVQE